MDPSQTPAARDRRVADPPLLDFKSRIWFVLWTLPGRPREGATRKNHSAHHTKSPIAGEGGSWKSPPSRVTFFLGLSSFLFTRRYWGNHCCFLFLRLLICLNSAGSHACDERLFFFKYRWDGGPTAIPGGPRPRLAGRGSHPLWGAPLACFGVVGAAGRGEGPRPKAREEKKLFFLVLAFALGVGPYRRDLLAHGALSGSGGLACCPRARSPRVEPPLLGGLGKNPEGCPEPAGRFPPVPGPVWGSGGPKKKEKGKP